MQVTAADAKSRLGQMLEDCQREPVIIEKSGRRHSVLLSARRYDELVAATAEQCADAPQPPRTAEEFYARYKPWVDAQTERFERIGIWNEEFRRW